MGEKRRNPTPERPKKSATAPGMPCRLPSGGGISGRKKRKHGRPGSRSWRTGPIQATAVDSDEVDRMVTQRLEEELAKQMPRQQEEQEQAARDAYDAFILTARSLDNLWRTLKPQIARLAPDQKNGAKNLLLQKLMEVKEELIHACEDHQP